jgi:nucleoside diphosphate kinase
MSSYGGGIAASLSDLYGLDAGMALGQDLDVLDVRGQDVEVHTVELELTPGHCDSLYPDAYGAEFVAQRTAYLTSGPVQAVVLAGDADAVACGAALKRTVRADLGAEMLRNHLHMPDNPAEALADIALLAGWDQFQRLYRRWENDERRLAARMAGYRDHLDRRDRGAGVVGPQRVRTAL